MSTAAMRAAWDPPCSGSFSTISLYGTGKVRVKTATTPAVLALNECLKRHNYRTHKADTGAFNCRAITGGVGYSLHAYGIAIDINWQNNPYGPRLITDMPPAMVNDIKALRTNNGKTVWRWGGDFRGNKDAMHYEIICTPADIATGIRGGTAPSPPKPTPPKPVTTHTGEIEMFLAINGVGLFAVVNGVPIGFPDMAKYAAALKASPTIPVMVLDKNPGEKLFQELLKKHNAILGADQEATK